MLSLYLSNILAFRMFSLLYRIGQVLQSQLYSFMSRVFERGEANK